MTRSVSVVLKEAVCAESLEEFGLAVDDHAKTWINQGTLEVKGGELELDTWILPGYHLDLIRIHML